MVLTSAALIASGVACLFGSGYTLYSASPKAGRPANFWTRTETRSTLLALAIVTSFIIGSGLVLKGILS
jgi:hypothetical protein